MLWLILAAMICFAALVALWPLLRPKPRRREPSDAAFFRTQPSEIERDVERGQLPATEAGAARAEVARRLMALGGRDEPRRVDPRLRRGAAIAIAVLIPVVVVAAYAVLGRPDLPDAPLATRQIDEAAPDAVEVAVTRVEAEITASPDNAKAWSALAPVYLRLGRYDDAVNAYRQALRLRGEDGMMRADLGEAEMAAAGGIVTAEARADFDRALADSPGLPMARFYLALAAEQGGDTAKAIEAYQSLLGELGDHPQWLEVDKARLAALKGETPPSPTAAAAVAQTTPAEDAPTAGGPDKGQQDMIRAMVARLADRLADKGGDADEWMRLIRSYVVLEEPEKAVAALASARKALMADASAAAKLDDLARELGLLQQ
jgi:cytochrome c-type biogenesis protein CcmH